MPGKRHDKWRLANGFLFVMAKTGSDHRGMINSLGQLRRLMGQAPWQK